MGLRNFVIRQLTKNASSKDALIAAGHAIKAAAVNAHPAAQVGAGVVALAGTSLAGRGLWQMHRLRQKYVGEMVDTPLGRGMVTKIGEAVDKERGVSLRVETPQGDFLFFEEDCTLVSWLPAVPELGAAPATGNSLLQAAEAARKRAAAVRSAAEQAVAEAEEPKPRAKRRKKDDEGGEKAAS